MIIEFCSLFEACTVKPLFIHRFYVHYLFDTFNLECKFCSYPQTKILVLKW